MRAAHEATPIDGIRRDANQRPCLSVWHRSRFHASPRQATSPDAKPENSPDRAKNEVHIVGFVSMACVAGPRYRKSALALAPRPFLLMDPATTHRPDQCATH